MGVEDRVEKIDQEGYRSLWEIQGLIRYTVRARNPADLFENIAWSFCKYTSKD